MFLNNTIVINLILHIKLLLAIAVLTKWLFPWPPDYSDLEITHEIDSQFYVAEVKDMVNIVQRLIADGKFSGIENSKFYIFVS